MDWGILLLVAVGGYFWRQHNKNKQIAETAKARLDKDTRLLQQIKSAKREYEFEKPERSLYPKHGDLLYATAHYTVHYVHHFAESRLGFYFKNIEEYGLYGFFAGKPGEYFDSYFRTDSTFNKEQRLLTHED